MSAIRLGYVLHMMSLMLADNQRTALFTATILFVSIAATHAQRASAQTVHEVGSTEIVDANGNRVGKLFEPSAAI